MCEYINSIDTKTKIVLLMHPKEYRKTKNRTGHLTKHSLNNSCIYVGIDFSENKEVNELINNSSNACYILYPGNNSINLNKQSIKSDKNIVIFVIDSTWACSVKMLRESKNLQNLQRVSFTHTKSSGYSFKTQPNEQALSTIESTLVLLEILNEQNIENNTAQELDQFLTPFTKMVEYQMLSANTPNVRYK